MKIDNKKNNNNSNTKIKMTLAGIVFLLCSFLQKGISTITTPIFTRLLSTSEYGVFSTYTAWSSIFTIFITLKISSGVLQQALVKYGDDKNNLLSSVQGLSTFLCTISLIIYLLFHQIINGLIGLSTPIMIAMIFSIWLTDVFEIWIKGERNDFNYKKIAILTIVSSLLKPILGIISILLFPKIKVEARIYSLLLTELICYSFLFVKNARGGHFYIKKYWKYSILFAIPLVPHYLSQTILSQTDRIMIKYMFDNTAVGIYSLAYQISMAFTLFNSAISNVLNPWIYKRIKSNNFIKFNEIISLLYRTLMILNLLLILFAPELVSFFAPSSYYKAIGAIPAVTMSCVFMFLYGIFACFEFYFEKKKEIAIASVLGAILNVILNLIFIPRYGFIAASYTTLFCYVTYCLMHFIIMKKICKENKLSKNILKSSQLVFESIIFVLIGLLVSKLYNYLFLRIFILILVGIIAVSFWKKIRDTLLFIYKK